MITNEKHRLGERGEKGRGRERGTVLRRQK